MEIWLFVGSVIGIVNGIVVSICTAIYVWWTIKIFNQNQRIFNVKYVPLIVLEFNKTEKIFSITNYGEGIAFNIEIEPLEVVSNEQTRIIKFEKRPALPPGKSETVKFKETHNGIEGKGPKVLFFQLTSENSPIDYTVKLKMRDVLGDSYNEEINMGKNGIFIKKHYLVKRGSKKGNEKC